MTNYKHGHKCVDAQTPTYSTWSAMRGRCAAKSHAQYKDYGGRGITVCARWNTFENFLADMGERPADQWIERINSDGNYEPGNCRWATRAEQMRNKRNHRMITFQGREMCLAEAIELSVVTEQLFEQRVYSRGWSAERALTTPPRAYRKGGN